MESHMGEYDAPIQCLMPSTRQCLAIFLDPPSHHVTTTGLPQDILGLAELSGMDAAMIHYLESKPNRTEAFLEIWGKACQKSNTIGKMLEYLQQLERKDIQADLFQKIVEDARHWKLRKESAFFPTMPQEHSFSRCLTVDDVQNDSAQHYSLCVCCADSDLQLASDIKNLLSPTLNCFIPQQQLLVGQYEYSSMADVIEERCHGKILLIVSNDFNSSSACLFAINFAKSLDPDCRKRKVIPIVTEENVKLPRLLYGITMLKLYRFNNLESIKPLIITSLALTTNTVNSLLDLKTNPVVSNSKSTIQSVSNKRQYKINTTNIRFARQPADTIELEHYCSKPNFVKHEITHNEKLDNILCNQRRSESKNKECGNQQKTNICLHTSVCHPLKIIGILKRKLKNSKQAHLKNSFEQKPEYQKEKQCNSCYNYMQ